MVVVVIARSKLVSYIEVHIAFKVQTLAERSNESIFSQNVKIPLTKFNDDDLDLLKVLYSQSVREREIYANI